ncbi:MAG: hypothetical protein AAFX99_17770 [Myxococcota bacterium]
MAKKSWRDRDRMRGSGRSNNTSESNGPRRRVHTPKSPRGYMNDLNKLFDSGDVPDRFKEILEDTESASGSSAQRQKMLRQARNSESSSAFVSIIEAFVKKYDFPDDEDLLVRVLDHPDEAIVCEALDRLIEMDGRRPLTKRKIIGMKLKTITQIATDSKTIGLVDMLSERL